MKVAPHQLPNLNAFPLALHDSGVRVAVSIGKETDRSWDHGGDPSVLDFKLKEYGNESKMVIADRDEVERGWLTFRNA